MPVFEGAFQNIVNLTGSGAALGGGKISMLGVEFDFDSKLGITELRLLNLSERYEDIWETSEDTRDGESGFFTPYHFWHPPYYRDPDGQQSTEPLVLYTGSALNLEPSEALDDDETLVDWSTVSVNEAESSDVVGFNGSKVFDYFYPLLMPNATPVYKTSKGRFIEAKEALPTGDQLVHVINTNNSEPNRTMTIKAWGWNLYYYSEGGGSSNEMLQQEQDGQFISPLMVVVVREEFFPTLVRESNNTLPVRPTLEDPLYPFAETAGAYHEDKSCGEDQSPPSPPANTSIEYKYATKVVMEFPSDDPDFGWVPLQGSDGDKVGTDPSYTASVANPWQYHIDFNDFTYTPGGFTDPYQWDDTNRPDPLNGDNDTGNRFLYLQVQARARSTATDTWCSNGRVAAYFYNEPVRAVGGFTINVNDFPTWELKVPQTNRLYKRFTPVYFAELVSSSGSNERYCRLIYKVEIFEYQNPMRFNEDTSDWYEVESLGFPDPNRLVPRGQ